MPLTDDQRAMLQLLLQRGQSYEDIASLLGLDVEQVRARARAALTEIGGEDPDREVGLTDYLLGQADPIGRADVARQLKADGQTRDLADRLATQLRVIAPGAELPELPGAAAAPAKPRKAEKPATDQVAPPTRPAAGSDSPSTAAAARTGFAATLSKRQRQVIAALLGGGALIAIAILAVAGVFGGGDDGGPASDGGSDQAASNASGLTRAVLEPQGGGNAQGVAVFAQVRNTPVLQVNVANLEPTGRGEAYVIWLFGSERRAYPLVRESVGQNGQLRGATPVPTQLIQALQQGLFDSIDVSRASNAQINDALRQARRSQQLPRYAGTSIARGPITGPGFSAAGAAG